MHGSNGKPLMMTAEEAKCDHECLVVDIPNNLVDFVGHTAKGSIDIQQQFFQECLELGVQFKTQDTVNKKPIAAPSIQRFSTMPSEGLSYSELIKAWDDIMRSSTNWASPNFMGFPDSGNAVPALGSAILIPFLNQNLANQEICAPSATFIEMEVVHWLRQLLGYEVPDAYHSALEIGGILTLGGCLSNTVALVAAREHVFPGTAVNGLPVLAQQVRVLVPDIVEHYSVPSSMAWLGLGEKNVVRVPVDEAFRMRLHDLDQCIDEERKQGNHVIMCIAYAGDSRSMCVDDLNGIAECLQRKNVWFHVDACHGSQLAFSRKHRYKIRGIEKADSVTIDPHKVLWIPNTCSFVLFKDPKTLAAVATDSELILRTQWSLGQITPFIGSKAFDSLKLWSNIKFFGLSGIEKLIDKRLEMTARIQCEIRRRDSLLLLNDTDINSCVFLFAQGGCSKKIAIADLPRHNATNRYIKERITEAGAFYLHGFTLDSCQHNLLPAALPVYVLRIMNGNPLIETKNITTLLDQVDALGQEYLRQRML